MLEEKCREVNGLRAVKGHLAQELPLRTQTTLVLQNTEQSWSVRRFLSEDIMGTADPFRSLMPFSSSSPPLAKNSLLRGKVKDTSQRTIWNNYAINFIPDPYYFEVGLVLKHDKRFVCLKILYNVTLFGVSETSWQWVPQINCAL